GSLGAGAQRGGHQRSNRSEDDRAIELLWRRLRRRPSPLGAELTRERLPLLVPLASEGEDAPALVDGDLAEDVSRGAEAVEADPLGVAGQAQRPIADQPGTEQRRRLLVGIPLWDREAEALVGDRQLGISAIEVVAGEAGAVAEG